jgi:hypothetical protein
MKTKSSIRITALTVVLQCVIALPAFAENTELRVLTLQELTTEYASSPDSDATAVWMADDASVSPIPQSKFNYSLPILPVIVASCDIRPAYDPKGALVGIRLGSVPSGNLVYDAGFRTGDTITKVITPDFGELSASRMNEFLAAIAKANSVVTIEFVRDQRQKRITFTKQQSDQESSILSVSRRATPTPFPVPTFVPSTSGGSGCFCWCPSGLVPLLRMNAGNTDSNCSDRCNRECACKDNQGVDPAVACCSAGTTYDRGDRCQKALFPPTIHPTSAPGKGGTGGAGSLRDESPVHMNEPGLAEW